MAKVSLVVSVYNVSRYVERCVRSLFEQTLEDVEFVFVDDGSTDGSMDIVLRVLEEYPNRKGQVEIIRHASNMGTAATKHDGMLAARGEYVLVVDSDDYVERNMAELLYGKAIEEKADMVLCEMYCYRYDGSRYAKALDVTIDDNKSLLKQIVNRAMTPSLSTKLIKKDIIREEEFVWPSNDYAEDMVISVQTVWLSGKIATVPVPLYHYCYNLDSICNNVDDEHLLERYKEFKANVDLIMAMLKKRGLEHECGEGMYSMSVYVKSSLLPLVGQAKYRKLWLKTYPEMNRVIFFGNEYHHSRIREKIWFLSIVLGLYRVMHGCLIGKRLAMGGGWYSGAVTLERQYKRYDKRA